VEVVECDNASTAPLPGKLLESSLRQTRSEEDLTRETSQSGCIGGSGVAPEHSTVQPCLAVNPAIPRNSQISSEFADWSLEDDEIVKVSFQRRIL